MPRPSRESPSHGAPRVYESRRSAAQESLGLRKRRAARGPPAKCATRLGGFKGSRTQLSGGVAIVRGREERSDGFGANAIAAHDQLDDRIGQHFGKGEFAIDETTRWRCLHGIVG